MSPARRLSDQDIMPRYRMTPSARARGPAPRIAERAPLAARERRQRRAEQPLTFAERAFAGAELRVIVDCQRQAESGHDLEDLEAKTRGLWWSCGGWTTRSFSNWLNALSPTLWPCGK
jgi:hypothetical protein